MAAKHPKYSSLNPAVNPPRAKHPSEAADTPSKDSFGLFSIKMAVLFNFNFLSNSLS